MSGRGREEGQLVAHLPPLTAAWTTTERFTDAPQSQAVASGSIGRLDEQSTHQPLCLPNVSYRDVMVRSFPLHFGQRGLGPVLGRVSSGIYLVSMMSRTD